MSINKIWYKDRELGRELIFFIRKREKRNKHKLAGDLRTVEILKTARDIQNDGTNEEIGIGMVNAIIIVAPRCSPHYFILFYLIYLVSCYSLNSFSFFNFARVFFSLSY